MIFSHCLSDPYPSLQTLSNPSLNFLPLESIPHTPFMAFLLPFFLSLYIVSGYVRVIVKYLLSENERHFISQLGLL